MTKAEKAIKELHWLQFNFPWQDNPENDADKMCNAIHKYAGDAIELLKEREPRVLTLEEVMKHYSLPPVFVDDLNMQEDYMQDIQPLYFEFQPDRPWNAHWLNYDQVANIREGIKARYGTIIRAWSAKPTDEQREAVKWDG